MATNITCYWIRTRSSISITNAKIIIKWIQLYIWMCLMYGMNIWWLIISISLHLFPAIPFTFCSCKWLNKLKVRGIRIVEKRCKQIEIINHQMLIPDMRHIHVYIRTGWHKCITCEKQPYPRSNQDPNTP